MAAKNWLDPLEITRDSSNWLDPVEIARDGRVLSAFSLVLCGIAAGDILNNIPFDFSIITKKRPWRCPMVLYFMCRLCMLLHIFAIAVELNAIGEIRCQEVTWISKITDAFGTCGSSLILVLRTRAVWKQCNKITAGLGLLFLGQIALWIQTFRFSRAHWDPQIKACAIVSTAPKPILVSVFAYTVAFDFVILILYAYKLSISRRSSTLGNLLLRSGIGYFCAVFGANLLQMVMAALWLNRVMNNITLPFALVISVIAATTVFRNVFIAYDGFSSESGGSEGTSSGGLNSGPLRLNTGGQRINPSRPMVNNVPLGQYKTHDVRAISVHRVVEFDVDGVPSSPMGQDVGSDHTSLTEKRHRIA